MAAAVSRPRRRGGGGRLGRCSSGGAVGWARKEEEREARGRKEGRRGEIFDGDDGLPLPDVSLSLSSSPNKGFSSSSSHTHILASHPQHQLGGVAPFVGDSVDETFNAVVRANIRFPTRIFRSVSKEAKDLLRKMLCKDVLRLLSAEQALGEFIEFDS
ncbi:hypothetical protein Droror1_Dr00019709 [Drosera rotundifolia]